MGQRLYLCKCLDCKEKYGEYPNEENIEMYLREKNGFPQPPYFWIKIEWKTKEELIEYIKEKTCPVCGSDNWKAGDYSTI